MRVLLPIVAVATALLVAACGGDDDPPQQQQQQQSAPQQEQSAQQPQTEQIEQQEQTQQQEQPAPAPATPRQQEQEDLQQQEQTQQQESAEEPVVRPEGEARILLPPNIDPEQPLPLVLLLHSFPSNADNADALLGISQLQQEIGGFALILPNGALNRDGDRYWNATDACCDLYGDNPDHVAFLGSLVEEARTLANIGPVYAVGISNGGFMAYRLACESLPGLTAVVSIAGSSYVDPERCDGAAPVSVLQIHGDEDQDVRYDGGLSDGDQILADTPGAIELISRWAERAGCDPNAIESLEPIEIEYGVSDNETVRQRIRQGCRDGITVELWTMRGVSHYPALLPSQIGDEIARWLVADARVDPLLSADPTRHQLGDDIRPAELVLPAAPDAPLPLIVLMHGYGMTADLQDAWFGLSDRVAPDRFALLLPNGTPEPNNGRRYWNGSAYCCGKDHVNVDDVAYLRGLIESAREHAAYDRVYAVGYSNGGFMAYRLACSGVDGLEAVVSLAGSEFSEGDDCGDGAPDPVSVLQIHGDRDTSILYEGQPDRGAGGYPGAVKLTRRWAERAACNADAVANPTALPPIDLDTFLGGDETTVQRIAAGCAGGVVIDLWTIAGAGHGPDLDPESFSQRIVNWLLDPSRPAS